MGDNAVILIDSSLAFFDDEVVAANCKCNDPDFVGILASYFWIFMWCCVWFKLIFELFILFYVNNFDLIRNILFGVVIIYFNYYLIN